jgi:hypothetical protein
MQVKDNKDGIVFDVLGRGRRTGLIALRCYLGTIKVTEEKFRTEFTKI